MHSVIVVLCLYTCSLPVCKISKLHNKYDNRNGWPSLQFFSNDRTRGTDMKLAKSHVRHDIRKHFLRNG